MAISEERFALSTKIFIYDLLLVNGYPSKEITNFNVVWPNHYSLKESCSLSAVIT